MAASLADLLIADFGEGGDDSGAADDGECWAHAESWTVAMIGGSMSSGSAAPSKYSSSASRRLASASSMVRQSGSHRQFRHLSKPGTVTVPGNLSDDLARGTIGSIVRQAGLPRRQR